MNQVPILNPNAIPFTILPTILPLWQDTETKNSSIKPRLGRDIEREAG